MYFNVSMIKVEECVLDLMKYGKYYSLILCIGGLIKNVKEVG